MLRIIHLNDGCDEDCCGDIFEVLAKNCVVCACLRMCTGGFVDIVE